MKKKLIGLMLALAMLITIIPCVYAASPVDEGMFDNGVHWILYDDGRMVIQGNGKIDSGYQWGNHTEQIKTVQIEFGITSIGEFAFNQCTSLTNIIVPSTLNSIERNAFEGCYNLEKVECDGTIDLEQINIDPIGNADFKIAAAMSNSSEGNVDSILTTQGECGKTNGAMEWTFNLFDGTLIINGEGEMADYVYHEENVYDLPDQPWKDYQKRIKKVFISSGITSIGMYAFDNCTNLTSITIPKDVTNLSMYALSKCENLERITLPENLEIIGHGALQGCHKLTSITIPENVTYIGVFAFAGTSISTINIPKNVSYIGGCAFNDCTSLSTITVDPDNKNYASENGFLFSKDKSTLLYYPRTLTNTTYTVPSNVKIIYEGAFQMCTSLKSITLSPRIQSIHNWMFQGCSNLTSIKIPDGVTNIEYNAFADCTSLQVVDIPASVISIDLYAFDDCKNLKDVYYSGSEEDWSKISIDYGNDKLQNASIHYSSSAPSPAPSNPLYTVTEDGTTIFHVPVHIQKGYIEIKIYDKFGNLKETSTEIRFDALDENGKVDAPVPCILQVGDVIRIYTRNKPKTN